jgi:Fic family protein
MNHSIDPNGRRAADATPELRNLEQDIAKTRDELDQTLEVLQARLSPRRQLENAINATRAQGGQYVRLATRTARRYPMPFVIAGIGLLITAVRATRRRARS